jgi:magnesium transporter
VSARERLVAHFADVHPRDAARALEAHAPETCARVVEKLDPDVAARLLTAVATGHAASMLPLLDEAALAAVLDVLSPDVTARLLRRCTFEARARVRSLASPSVAQHLSSVLEHPEHTAGAMMDPHVPVLPDTIDVGEGRVLVERSAAHGHYYQFVVDDEHRLSGVLTLRELFLAGTHEPITSIMQRDVQTLSLRADVHTILAHPAWRHIHALPVVDDARVLVGIVRYERLRELERERETASTTPLAESIELVQVYWDVSAKLLDVVLGQGRAPGGSNDGG